MIPTKIPKSSKPTATSFRLVFLMAALSLVSLLAGCSSFPSLNITPTPSPSPAIQPLPEALILYDWPGDIPQSVLDDFSEEYGIEINYVTYATQEEAIRNMRAGQTYDLVVMENEHLPALIADGLLAEIDQSHIPNLAHIAPNFKDLAYDPGNRHSVPFNWGITGLVVRDDLVAAPVSGWADLWNPAYAGKLAVRATPRELIGLTLKSLGFSANSENPVELEAARERLLGLRPAVLFVGSSAEEVLPLLSSGEVVILVGWAEDIQSARAENLPASYVLPEEGALMWGDNFVIPANSPHRAAAELLVNFLLRPEISAQITNENFYATPHQAARRFIKPEILSDPVIFPANIDLQEAEVLLALSPAAEQQYAEIWEQFRPVP